MILFMGYEGGLTIIERGISLWNSYSSAPWMLCSSER